VRPLLARRVQALAGAGKEETGNAIIEFVFLAVLLMVPLVYVLLTVLRVQGASYAVSSAAREAGRVYVTTAAGADPEAEAFAAASMVMADSGLELSPGQLHIECRDCRRPGATVPVSIDYEVGLPFLPRLFSRDSLATIHVSSSHLEVVDRFRAQP
jgi:Flp pilus assembly protein TadG